VLAAANPLYGTYDRKSSINMNVSLPDSLLSRFDMLFVVLDNTNTAMDKEVREDAALLLLHCSSPPNCVFATETSCMFV
jgi:DNA replication licensing factor MCM3